jgi:hypothetical protein
MNYQPVPIKIQEFQKIVTHLKKILKVNFNENIFILAKDIREHIISLDKNHQLSIYEITNNCIKYIDDNYINKSDEP